MGESSVLNMTVLAATAVLFVIAVVFVALYFRSRAANTHNQQRVAETENRLQQLNQELRALKNQHENETERLRADLAALDPESARPTGPKAVQTDREQEASPGLTSSTRVMPSVTATPATQQRETATAMFDIRAIEMEVDEERALPYLEIVSEIDKGKRFALNFKEAQTIGRSSSNHVVINDPSASRQHAEITFTDGYFVLRDNNSSNHTLCNQQKISVAKLQLGDAIRFANTDTKFSLPGFELMQTDSAAAIEALQQTLRACPDFIPALRTMAFLLERDVARSQDAHAIWARLKQLENT